MFAYADTFGKTYLAKPTAHRTKSKRSHSSITSDNTSPVEEDEEASEEAQRLLPEQRRSSRLQEENRTRWSVLVVVLDAKSEENEETKSKSNISELSNSVLERISIECKISYRQIRK